MEDAYYDLYFIINTALYAAEDYIQNTYGVVTSISNIQEYLGDVKEDRLELRYPLTNILSIYDSNGYALPSVAYIDEGVPTVTDGVLKINEKVLTNVNATNLLINYTSGYTYPPTAKFTSNTSEDTSEVGEGKTTPLICNPDGSPLSSPLTASEQYYDINVIGDPSADIYVNGVLGELLDKDGNTITEPVTPNVTINDERVGRVTLTLVAGLQSIEITTQDGSGNVSNAVTLVINYDSTIQTTASLINRDLVTNSDTFAVTLATTKGATIISIDDTNGIVEHVAYSSGIETINIAVPSSGKQLLDYSIRVDAVKIDIQILVDLALDTDAVNAINNAGHYQSDMPQDILMALLMIANHYFKIALYKHDETQSYGDNVSNRTTFIADRFPKDAHLILSKYVTY